MTEFHIHSRFCDGRNTPEEIAEAAVSLGLSAIGFSSHSPMPFESGWCMREEKYAEYFDEIERLKKKYAPNLEILAGLELDLYSELPSVRVPDYIISSTHFVKKDGAYLPVDETAARIFSDTDKYYGGDIFAYTRDFYEQVSHLCDRGPAVIGHFDLVTKFNEGGAMFDENDPRYYGPAYDAIDALAASDAVFEINTGAIFRGHRTEPYPSIPFLKRMKELGCRVILAGDCHCTDALCYKFAEAMEYAAAAGYTEFESRPPKFIPAIT